MAKTDPCAVHGLVTALMNARSKDADLLDLQYEATWFNFRSYWMEDNVMQAARCFALLFVMDYEPDEARRAMAERDTERRKVAKLEDWLYGEAEKCTEFYLYFDAETQDIRLADHATGFKTYAVKRRPA